MKKLLALLIVLFVASGTVFFVKNQIEENARVLPATTVAPTSTPKPSPTPAIKQSVVLDVDSVPTRISWAIADPQEVNLYSNLKDQHLSEQIKVDNSCSILVNGGFYSKEDTFLGLVIGNFSIVSPKIDSPLLNGFLSIKDDNISIGSTEPTNNPRIAIQTGPLLVKNGEALTLAINNDEPSRRIVAATTDDGKLLFLAFYRDSNEYEGPLLQGLPEVTKSFEKQTGINVVDAINLDGGIHSVFITNYVRLVEMAHIGSYFCAK